MKPGKLSSYTDLELALMIMCGYYGNGAARKTALGSRYNAAQAIVDKMINSGKVPDGSAHSTAQIRSAISKAFTETINEFTNEIVEKL